MFKQKLNLITDATGRMTTGRDNNFDEEGITLLRSGGYVPPSPEEDVPGFENNLLE